MKKALFTSIFLFGILIISNAQEQDRKPSRQNISKVELISMNTIVELYQAIDPATDCSLYTFRSFDLILNLDGVEFTETAYGTSFSQKQKNLISKAPTGTKIFIEHVSAVEKSTGVSKSIINLLIKITE